MKRFSSVRKLHKLKQNVEKCILSQVVCSKFILKSHFSFSSHVSVTLYWTHTSRAQLSVGECTQQSSYQKHVWTIESFLLQIKARLNWRKMIQKMNSVLIRKKGMRIKGNQRNHELSRKLCCEITHGCTMKAMFCYFHRKSKKTNPFTSAEGCINFRTSTLQRRKRDKGMLRWDSAVKRLHSHWSSV